MGEANTLAPMASPELPPATSYVVVLLSSHVCLSDRRAPLVSRRAQAGAGRGPRHFWATLSADARASRAAVFFRAGPAVVVRFSILFCFILFHRFVYIFKNVYLLVGRSK